MFIPRELPTGVLVAESRDALASGAAEWIEGVVEEELEERSTCRLLLAGGQTPRAVYARLADAPEIEWDRCELWWGDERCVPPDHADSNFRMVNETLLQPLAARGVAPARVVRWLAERPPHEAAAQYEAELSAIATAAGRLVPRFDFVLLGMGADGHTASLFPRSPALAEEYRLAVANPLRGGQGTRLTVTWPLIEAARQVTVLIAGADKAQTLAAVMHGPLDLERLPIQRLLGHDEEVTWFLDADAARALSGLTNLNRL